MCVIGFGIFQHGGFGKPRMLGVPLLSSADAPQSQVATWALLVLFLIGATHQILRLRARHR